jgi:hypothetical protein
MLTNVGRVKVSEKIEEKEIEEKIEIYVFHC